MPVKGCVDLATDLHAALDRDEFRLDAQPQFHLRTGKTVGIEVFLRWRNSDGFEMAPSDYLPLVEGLGFAGRIRDWVLERACRIRASWRDQGVEAGRVCVNVTEAEFDRGLPTSVQRCLEKCGLAARHLEIEIPETALTGVDLGVREIVVPLKDMGVGITVDGFGTGLASLRELKRIHPDRLKIDKSLTQGASVDRDKSAITRSIIALAHTMGMSVVAEGIETEADLEFLRWEACETGQGNLLASPLSIEAMAEFLKARSGRLTQP
jgi:EAL domain-containing protein (putative c-di-GMP-specific phosphodiesterase class I)